MRTLTVFNQLSLDGYFSSVDGDISWTHRGAPDPEFEAFISGNASQGGELVFGRKTYDMMASFWTTPRAAEQFPVVARGMNDLPKVVFSRKLKAAPWNNTRLLAGDPVDETRRLKTEDGPPLVILGSGSIVAPLAKAGLVDAFQLVVMPVVLGAGRTMFEGSTLLDFALQSTRAFGNGNVLLIYEPKADRGSR